MALPPDETASQRDRWSWDPAYLMSLRELWIIFAFFAVMLGWTIGASYWLGYPSDRTAPVELWRGVPKWFVIAVAVPWGLATLVSIGFALFWMKDDEPPADTSARLPEASPALPSPQSQEEVL